MLAQWINEPITEVNYKKDPLLLKIFFASQVSKPQILTQLRLQRILMLKDYHHLNQELKEHLETQQALIPPEPLLQNTFLLWEQTRQYGESYFEMYIQWLDACIEIIEAEMIDTQGKSE